MKILIKIFFIKLPVIFIYYFFRLRFLKRCLWKSARPVKVVSILKKLFEQLVRIFFLDFCNMFDSHWYYEVQVEIRQKVNLKTEVTRKQSTLSFRKKNIPYPLIRTLRCSDQGVRNVRFSENLVCFVFFLPPFWELLFCLITDVLIIIVDQSFMNEAEWKSNFKHLIFTSLAWNIDTSEH